MYLSQLNILDYKNIQQAELTFIPKLNCLIGMNGMGKTNVIDAIYYLSFCKSAFTGIDSLNIRHEASFAMLQGVYKDMPAPDGVEQISCGIKRGVKKQFRRGKKEYKRLTDHIGLLPLVLVSPHDKNLIDEGSDERRKFMDSVISQCDKVYLQHILDYNALLKQRNSLLKQIAERGEQWHAQLNAQSDILDILEMQLAEHAEYIFTTRTTFINNFIPLFQELHAYITNEQESVTLTYQSQLQERNLIQAFRQTRERDVMLGWSSQGIHKDDLYMFLDKWLIHNVGSEGQKKTYIMALKLAQAEYLTQHTERINTIKPILLLDDIFDKLDGKRVERIISLVGSNRFGQIFFTDTNREHLLDLLQPLREECAVFIVENGEITPQQI